MSTEKFNDQGQGGFQQNNPDGFNQAPPPEELGTPLTIVSFCIPLVGLILYLVNKDKAPAKAKTAGTAALIGFCLGMVLNIIAALLR